MRVIRSGLFKETYAQGANDQDRASGDAVDSVGIEQALRAVERERRTQGDEFDHERRNQRESGEVVSVGEQCGQHGLSFFSPSFRRKAEFNLPDEWIPVCAGMVNFVTAKPAGSAHRSARSLRPRAACARRR